MRQEVAAALVSHIGSGSASEVSAALDLLTGLANDLLPGMQEVVVFLKVCCARRIALMWAI